MVIGEEVVDNIEDPLIMGIGEIDDNGLIGEVLSIVEGEQFDANNDAKLIGLLIISSVVFPASISFVSLSVDLESVSLFPVLPPLFWLPDVLLLFFTIVSPSAVMIFFGHRFNLVCLMRPLRYVNLVLHCVQLYAFSPECFLRCSLSCCLVLHVKAHSGQG